MQKDILFIDASCKSREKYLLGKEKYQRLIDGQSYKDSLKLLREFGFSQKSPEDADISTLLYNEEEDLIDFIKEYAPKGGVNNYFLLPYDFINAEALLKCQKLGLSEQKYLTHQGVLTIDELKDALLGKPCKIKEINKAFTTALELFETTTPTGAMIDTIFTTNMYLAMRRLVKNSTTLKFINREIDLKNISIILRSQSLEEYYNLKLPSNTLNKGLEEVLIGKDKQKILQAFKSHALYPFIEKAVAEMGSPLVNFEKLSESYNLSTLKETRFFNRGVEPYLLYVCYRKADIKNVRLIMVSLRSGVDKESIKQKLRDSYQS